MLIAMAVVIALAVIVALVIIIAIAIAIAGRCRLAGEPDDMHPRASAIGNVDQTAIVHLSVVGVYGVDGVTVATRVPSRRYSAPSRDFSACLLMTSPPETFNSWLASTRKRLRSQPTRNCSTKPLSI